ncbi:MAG: type II secretion system F family protein [Candidatus Bathyarchaeota archaeon]|nr:type II secretion system F family protein [Candidatus Bathyarchaeota archaeon]
MKKITMTKITPTQLLFNKRFQIAIVGASIAAGAAITLIGYLMYITQTIAYFNLHVFIAISIMISLIAPAVILILQDRRRNQIDRSLPRVLEAISEGLQAGMTLIESIDEVSKQDYGWTSKELRIMVAQLSWGVPIETALDNFAKRVGTEMTKKTTALLTAAIRLGGDLKALFRSTAEFLHKMHEAKDERNEQLRPYLSIIYVTLVVFVVTMYMLYNSLAGLFELQSSILQVRMSQEELKILLFDLAMLEAIFGGLIASKLSSGTIYPGLKHSIIMLVINTACFVTLF